MEILLEQRLITVEEYHKMAEAGILKPDDRVELLNGKIIKTSPIGSKHAACVDKTDEFLRRVLSGLALVRAQNPVIMSDLSEPEPDIAILKRKENYYADKHPTAEDVILIIEVADSSLEIDRQSKLPIYAAGRIPEYWIVNVEKREIEVYQSPFKGQYRSREIYFPEDEIPISAFNISAPVNALLV
ncbi:MAG: Uma2 family endonuclease [Phaeodactylibacter sp.]|nr:Uma2 family endonuclease [Phaeodactylibacter sp.]